MPTFLQMQTTQDALFLALAISVLAIAFFLCRSLYYIALTAKDLRQITGDLKNKLEAFWDVVNLLREKLSLGGTAFKLAAYGIKEIADYFKGWAEKEDKKKK